MTTHTIKIAIAEDHQIVVDGIKSIITNQSLIEVVGNATNERDILYLLQKTNPAILILDLNLEGKSGFDILKKVKVEFKNTKVIILTMYNEPAFIRKAKALGASAYLLKNYDTEELLNVINSINSVDFQLSKGITLLAEADPIFNTSFTIVNTLSPKEKEIIVLVAKGMSSKNIAEHLFLSIHTVDTHRRNLLKKLNLPNTASLVSFAYENNMVHF